MPTKMKFTNLLASLWILSSRYAAVGSNLSGLLTTLKHALSLNASVHIRGSTEYNLLTSRWQYWSQPDFAAVVSVATAADVSVAIKFANEHDIHFSAHGGGHGSNAALAGLQNGLQINLRRLNTVQVAQDQTSASVGGGSKSKELSDTLWNEDKWTVHGCCECPGVLGVALGGGHGILQGRYGLLSDQVISLDVVLANGSTVQVSESHHKDLFRAMRGAGHNFGIVTGVQYRVYDIPKQEIGGKTWSCEVLIWEATVDNVRKVYEIAKGMVDNGSQPDGMLIYGVVAMDPGIGQVVLMLHIVHNAPIRILRPFAAPYHALSPLNAKTEEGTYLDVPRWLMTEDGNVACDPSKYMSSPGIVRFPVDVKTYDVPALVKAVQNFAAFVMQEKEFAASFFLIEQYATHKVRENKGRGMVPWRENVLLIAPALLYTTRNTTSLPPTPLSHLEDRVVAKGKELRQILIDGAKETGGYYSYVNYAYGGETPEEVYGQENLAELRRLKGMYDPNNRFRWFAPFVEAARVGAEIDDGQVRDEL